MGLFDEAFSAVEVAGILGVHRVTVAAWIRQGALGAARTPGGRYLVSRSDLRRFLLERGMSLPPSLAREKKRTIVAVDDDPVILEILAEFCAEAGLDNSHILKTFHDPLEAALFIGAAKPDLVLLDLLMPQLDGFQLANKIKETSPGTRIVFITGHATPSNMQKIDRADIDGILYKPFDLRSFQEMLSWQLPAE